MGDYVHGYSVREKQRLEDQAVTLTELLHHDTIWPAGDYVLEAGCGVGAQTITLARQNPDVRILSVDISEESLETAKIKIDKSGFTNVTFQQADIFELDFAAETFDHIFLCFVLEHLPNPEEALQALKRVLKTGGTLTAIEGDHGSTFFHPDNEDAQRAIDCLIELQAGMGGDSLVGRRLFPLLSESEFINVYVDPRMVYVDGSRPELVEGFTKNTFAAMVEGVREQSIQQGLMAADAFARGVRALYRCAESDGVFCYTFFKAVCTKP
jgi:SAM-dependent methyltransferase